MVSALHYSKMTLRLEPSRKITRVHMEGISNKPEASRASSIAKAITNNITSRQSNEKIGTFVRRLLHSVQAADALLILTSSTPPPGGAGGGGRGPGSVRGAMGRNGLVDPCWAMVYKRVY